MAWIEESVRQPAVRPESELWAVCKKCGARVEKRAWNGTCPKCGAPSRMGCRARAEAVSDKGTFVEINASVTTADPIKFSDAGGSYAAKAAATKAKTGLGEAVLTGLAKIHGIDVVLGVMDFSFLGGSLGSGAGERIVLAAEEALKRQIPLVMFCASGGARMHEGIVSLMQMARTCAAISRLHDAGIPYVSVLTDPTTGGVSASFALTADVVLAEPRALIGFAGRRVIENTIKQKLPDDFQTAEYMLAHGFVDAIVKREEMADAIAKVLSYSHPAQSPAKLPKPAAAKPSAKLSAWETVQIARGKGRPTIDDYISLAFDDFFELHGDRLFGDDHGLIGGLATIGGIKVVLIGQRKGRTVEESIDANFGMANPEGYRKALRLMKLAEHFGIPVVSLVDTAGAYPGLDAEARGQAEAIGRNLCAMAGLRTPIVSVITGEGGSGGAIGIAVGDRVMMLENAVYSVISPEGCASILWRDGAKAPEAAEALKITASSLLKLGIVDSVIPEPAGGAQKNPALAARRLKLALCDALKSLLRETDGDALRAARYEKFMKMGR